ncbi:hypothetical protein K3495_g7313 [Podosphaera aphanis]|nr:hypothetical protein K3495_g7313 [Podosphaera aphanis]
MEVELKQAPVYAHIVNLESMSSDVSTPDLLQEILCYKCDSDDHLAEACPFSDEIKVYGIALRKKIEKRNLMSRKIKPPRTSSARKAAKKTRNNRLTKSGKSHSYTACEDSSLNSDSSIDEDFAELSESGSDRSPAQEVMLSKALISKSTSNHSRKFEKNIDNENEMESKNEMKHEIEINNENKI